MMRLRDCWAAIRADAATYGRWQTEAGFWVTLSYRVRRQRKSGAVMQLLLILPDLVLGFVRWAVSDSKIPSHCEVGPGLCLPHAHGIIVNRLVTIGSSVRIFQQVTIGVWNGGVPTLMDGCSIYAGARVFGPITIGRNARIGPNTVIETSVPDNATVRTATPIVLIRRQALEESIGAKLVQTTDDVRRTHYEHEP